ncbi:MAG TPA: SPOR domain-containing protein [Puia sp.]|nr:SPOR domain-containing protein [Puia sp.]
MYKCLIILLLFISQQTWAQADTTSVVVNKDARVDELIRKQVEINEETTRDSRRNMPGFRLQVISSQDRNKVFAAKARILQQFPDLKPYLMYQAPNYKLKVGNFKTQEEAEEYQKELSRLFPSGLFIIRDTIEVKLEKMKEEGDN